MSGKAATLNQAIERFVVEARLLGLEQTMSRRKTKVKKKNEKQQTNVGEFKTCIISYSWNV